MPAIDRAIPAVNWQLSEDGRAAARKLGEVIPKAPTIVTSDEPKAYQTAEQLLAVRGGALSADVRLRETRRPVDWNDDYRSVVAEYLCGGAIPGWERQEDVVQRFDDAVRDGIAHTPDGPLAFVTHGQAMTLWLTSVNAFDDPVAFWSELRLPDAWHAVLGDHDVRVRRLAGTSVHDARARASRAADRSVGARPA